jgi:hypothetical protein
MTQRRLLECLLASSLAVSPLAHVQGQDLSPEMKDLLPSKQQCLGELPPGKGHYPFAVEEIANARKAATLTGEVDEAQVVVVDNMLVGKGSGAFDKLFFGRGNPAVAYDQPDVNIVKQDMAGHGTYVTGIVLGGQYEDDSDPAGSDLARPNVRRLLIRPLPPPGQMVEPPSADGDPERQPSYLIKVWVMGLARPGQPYDNERIRDIERELTKRKADIVNMSFLRHSTAGDGTSLELKEIPKKFPDQLFIVAAGNGEQELTADSTRRYPAMASDAHRNLIVVASHNADDSLSHFSNYGATYIELAAPGCGIKSWLPDSKKPDKPLNGTSMATPIVTFAAALLKSVWKSAGASDLHDRLINSARFSEELTKCKSQTSAIVAVDCVRNASILDIPAALVYNVDLLEYCDVPARPSGPCPRQNIVKKLGKLLSIPAWMTQGRNETPGPAVLSTQLSPGGAIRRGPKDQLQHLFTAKVSDDVVENKMLTIEIGQGYKDLIHFVAQGWQLNGEKLPSSTDEAPIETWRLIRIVRSSDVGG